MPPLYYFAYGSNLSPSRMKTMYKGDVPESSAARLAVVQDWKWIINKHGIATIVEDSDPDAGHVVWGKIYPMSELNEASLDRARPDYVKGFLQAKFGQEEEDVLVYIDVENVVQGGNPKQDYKDAINEGVADALGIAGEDRRAFALYVEKYIRPFIPPPGR